MNNQEIETVFLLGAGASAEYLPIANEMRDDIRSQMDKIVLKKTNSNNFLLDNVPTNTYFEFAYNHLKFLYNESYRFPTIDSLAIALSLRNDQEGIRKLKYALSLYFSLKQHTANVDKRYLQFLPLILNGQKINNKFRILTWNYDYQLELSLCIILNLQTYNQSKSILNLITPPGSNSAATKPFFFKLNGTAGFIDDFGSNFHFIKDKFTDANDNYSLDSFIEYHNSFNNKNHQSSLNFAWEKSIKNDFLEGLNHNAKNAKNLVIIGYSFPQFNREIDKRLLNELKNTDVYIQCKNDNEEIEGLLKREFNINRITKINQTKSFYIPRI